MHMAAASGIGGLQKFGNREDIFKAVIKPTEAALKT
jgi:hypothetical protein